MEHQKKVNLIITDLDDTIWDWFSMWYNSFEPYIKRISTEFNIDLSVLKSDFKSIHTRYGSTEFSFVYQDLTCLSQEQKNKFEIHENEHKSIIHQYNSLKKNNLRLYPGTRETLIKLKKAGVMLVGFTESNAFFTKYRIKHLELDGLIDYIYAPIDTGVPKSVYKHYPEDYWEPEITEFRYLSKEVKKPAPEILEIIIKDLKAKKDNSIYIGDKPDKDISMANDAEIDSVFAKYGSNIDDNKYQLLRDVTHWNNEDVEKEKIYKLKNNEAPLSKYILNSSFEELYNNFNFFNFERKIDTNYKDSVIKTWEKTIDVQQHFNDIELKIRNFALTAYTFLIGGVGYLEKEELSFCIGNFIIPYASILTLFGIVIILAFFFMDKYWYHRLLQGAVKHAILIETKWSRHIPEIRLTSNIRDESPIKVFRKKEIHSKHKIPIFYCSLIITLFLLAIMILCIRNIG